MTLILIKNNLKEKFNLAKMPPGKQIRIVVAGEKKVGKTTFISSLFTESAVVDSVIGPVVFPTDMFNQNQECTSVLIDTSSDPNDIELVMNEFTQADVILLMYDLSDGESVQKLYDYWIKHVNKAAPHIPVIIVANKLDLTEDQKLLKDDAEFFRIPKVLKSLVRNYHQVEMGMECSAKQGKSIVDVIHCAQRACLYPLAPLYEINRKSLTEGFKKALTRIFRLCDKDGDGKWNDNELMQFQRRVFKRELDHEDIKGIKEMIRDELQNNSNDQELTLEGFIALQKSGIELMKIQICWTILRYFKYQDDLKLDNNIFNNELIIDKEAGQTAEISAKVVDFLQITFKRYAYDDLLQTSLVQDIFYPAPQNPWNNINQITNVAFNHSGKECLTFDNWKALWNQHTYFNYKDVFVFLKYIGFDGTLNDAFNITNKKDCFSEFIKLPSRNVFHVVLVVPQNDNTQYLKQLIENQNLEILDKDSSVVTLLSVQQKNKFVIWSLTQGITQDFFSEKNFQHIDFVIFINCNPLLGLRHPFITIFNQDTNQVSQIQSSEISFKSVISTYPVKEIKIQISQAIQNPTLFLDSGVLKILKDRDTFLSKPENIAILTSALAILSLSFFYLKQFKQLKNKK